MAPSKKKKKKIVSNPNRGVATTSLPSKARDLSAVAGEGEDSVEHEFAEGEASSLHRPAHADDGTVTSSLNEMTLEELECHLEDAELQSMIESYSTRCKQEATKQVLKLENERRQLRSQALPLSTVHWLSDEVVEKILQQRQHHISNSRNLPPLDFFDDLSLLPKLWTVMIILERLNFSNINSAIEHLLVIASQKPMSRSIDNIWGLQEVLEWYAMNGLQKDLPDYDHEHSKNQVATRDVRKGPDTEAAVNPPTTQTVPAIAKGSLLDRGSSPDHDEGSEILPPLSPTDSDDDDPSLLADQYIRFQTSLFHTELHLARDGKNTTVLERRRSRLQRRIAKISHDVLFDQSSADAIWTQKLRDLRIDASRAAKPSRLHKEQIEVNSKIQGSDEADSEDGMLGGMFGNNEDDDSTAGNHEQTAIRIIDFGKWSGMQPQKLLEESCHGHDDRSSVKFYQIAATTYSSRQKLELRWSTQHIIEPMALSTLPESLCYVLNSHVTILEMNTVATVNQVQAEAYLSTIALFLLVHSGHVDNKLSNRLPTIWRDLYSDLCQTRQSLVDNADKQTLKALRRTVHTIRQSIQDSPESTISDQIATSSTTRLPARAQKEYTRLSTEEAQALWRSKVATSTYQTILPVRERLPIYSFKDLILRNIAENQLVIVCADTGAGKSTQVPAFVLEHELSHGRDCRILVTQPRRISAISLAKRVSQELGEYKKDVGTERSLLGYAIRLESKISKSTRITYATTGVLLRMVEASPQLNDLDYLILDEVHERTMETDLFFIVLKRILERRANLKIVLMSATVDAQKFSNYFNNAPILDIPGRTFPVEVFYLEDAIENTLDIKTHGGKSVAYIDEADLSTDDEKEKTKIEGYESYSNLTRLRLDQMDEYRIDYELIASLVEAIATKEKYIKYSSAILVFMPGIAEIRRLYNALHERDVFSTNWTIHLLHSSFSTEELEMAFAIPSPNHRKIVIATNIAETGITIPDITAVIDTCKEKVMRFDERRQLSRLTEGFISRSSARQRRGRAARVRDGLCFHLVSRYRFEHFMVEQHVPEMLRLSLQDPILRTKVWNLGSVEATLAAAIDPPTSKNIRRAVDKLQDAGALSTTEELTHLGKIIARLPLEVLPSKLAVLGVVFKCLDATLTIVAMLTSKSPFLPGRDSHAVNPRLAFARGESDLISGLNAYQGWQKARMAGQAHTYCRRYHLSDQSLSSIYDQKIQLVVYLADAGLIRLSHDEEIALSRWRNAGNRRTHFDIPDRYNTYSNDAMINAVVAMAFYPKILTREGKGWRNVFSNQRVNMSHSSIHRAVDKPPKWLSFYEAIQTKNGTLNALETSKVSEMVIATILGSADYRFFSGVMVLENGRIRFNLRQWRQLAAVKVLRNSITAVLDRCWQSPGLCISESDRVWIELFAAIVE